MSLYVVSTPIGNPRDYTERARQILTDADLIIGEELKALRQILKAVGVQGRALDQLNEHSREADVAHLLEQARTKMVALVSDCGTPGFCDPGAELVDACHKAGVKVHPVPGASSLMALLSVCGIRLEQFTFFGFLPAKRERRDQRWRELLREGKPAVILETPYRIQQLVDELKTRVGERDCVLGLDLTSDTERILRGRGRELGAMGPFVDAEPICLIMPGQN